MQMQLPANLPPKAAFEDRVLTACKTLRALDNPDARFMGFRINRRWLRAIKERRGYSALDAAIEYSEMFTGMPKFGPYEEDKDNDQVRPTGGQINSDQADDEAHKMLNDKRLKFMPPPEQVDDCLPVMGWCAKLERKKFRLIWARSFGASFQKMANQMRADGTLTHSYQSARRRYFEAIDDLYEISLGDANA